MNYKQKLIQRHKNPIGLILRLITYIAICYSLWMHNINLLLLLIILDISNWFFMPMVNPKSELKIVNKVVETEIDWIKSPLNLIKYFSIITGLGLFILLGVGLWKHNWVLLIMAFVSISILKHLILKTTSNQ
ncbi:hypothetical protein [Muriicola sp. Z0-33]|uniref:hypothetical protein n=1 Tax=Muriicola sp. Z0-33 TaxID=2816957 RepID=UPI0022386ACA|nr:hypothetical protein [Muriicola sp. Z0-33]MCW5517610.1 hypothetical protein [Muriicola sp. Z0-33]